MLSIPRALPPVTHGSALQAPECLWDESSYWEQDKNQINPLERMEGDALAAMLPLWSYKS